MKILMVDDEFDAVALHIATLRRTHEVAFAASVLEAYELLRSATAPSGSKQFDIVLIDLMLGDIPSALQPHYRALHPGRHNEGQALGQWLWSAYASGNPTARYAYYSNFPDNFQLNRTPASQELVFVPGGQPERQALLRSKWDIGPAQLEPWLGEIEAVWSRPLRLGATA